MLASFGSTCFIVPIQIEMAGQIVIAL